MSRLKDILEKEYQRKIDRCYKRLVQRRLDAKSKVENKIASLATVKAAFKEVIQEYQDIEVDEELKEKIPSTLLQ